MRRPTKRAVKRFNSPLFGEVVRRLDGRVWFAMGLVIEDGDDGYDSHGGKDVTVRVELQPGGEVVRCRVGATCAGPGYGIWKVPPVGAEVAIGFPDGEFDAGGVIVSVLSTGAIPDGVNPQDIVIVVPAGGTVYVRTPDGETDRLVRKSEFDGHKHGKGTLKDGNSLALTSGETGGADEVEGTQALRSS